MAVDANLRFVQPEGLALAIIIVSLVFLFFSLLSVGIRIYIRQSDNALGLDDWLVLGGVVCSIHCIPSLLDEGMNQLMSLTILDGLRGRCRVGYLGCLVRRGNEERKTKCHPPDGRDEGIYHRK